MINRRNLLHIAAASGFYSLLPSLTLAAANTDRRLVVIIQRGGMDSLDAVQPWGDAAFKVVRPPTGVVVPANAFAVDSFYAFHEALKPLHPMFQARELSVIHGVSTPYRARSHFEAQDFLERGADGNIGQDSGWVNRLITLLGGKRVEFAADIGTGPSFIMRGPAPALNVYPETDLSFWADSTQFLEMLYKDDAAFKPVIDSVKATGTTKPEENSADAIREMSQFAAKLLKQDCRIAAFSIHGWDTHSDQNARLGKSLGTLADAITTLKAELGDVWAKTLVVVASEFGRTAHFNGTGGTDHGTGGAAFLAGGLLANGAGGKVITSSKWPGLNDNQLFEGRDLNPTEDVRRYIGWALADLYDLSPDKLAISIFPGVEMGSKIRII
jgi:uncharacterized protein (DUF1501 family)